MKCGHLHVCAIARISAHRCTAEQQRAFFSWCSQTCTSCTLKIFGKHFKLAITPVIFAILSSLSGTEKEFTFKKLKSFILLVLLLLIVQLLPPLDCYNVIPNPVLADFFWCFMYLPLLAYFKVCVYVHVPIYCGPPDVGFLILFFSLSNLALKTNTLKQWRLFFCVCACFTIWGNSNLDPVSVGTCTKYIWLPPTSVCREDLILILDTLLLF